MKHLSLDYHQPAKTWFEGIPLGSGDLGLMVEEDYLTGQYGINLDTLWSGYPKDKNNPSASKNWAYIRECIAKKEYSLAEEEVMANILGDWTDNYLPAGNLRIRYLMDDENPSFFHRKLNLDEAIYQKQMQIDEDTYTHQAFVSLKDSVFCLRIHKQTNGVSMPVSMELELSAQLEYELQAREDGMILKGKAPSYMAPIYCAYENPIRYEDGKGLDYSLALKINCEEGDIELTKDNKLRLHHGKNIEIYIVGETSYHREKSALISFLENKLKTYLALGFEELRQRHIKEYQGYYQRLELTLSQESPKDTLSFMENLSNTDKSGYIYELMFHYARYLMICSSKPKTQAGNLQGIWNPILRAPWSSNYTVNINTEMNYWFVEGVNLSDCHEPLFDLIEKTAKNGKITAKNLYGLDGWVSHHNIDLWGHSSPVGYNAGGANSTVYGFWPMSSGWLCRHLWDHYLYSLDEDFLREKAYPLIEGAVRFYQGYLIYQDGYYMTSPSTSPENTFLDEQQMAHALSVSSTMDMSILKELFDYYQKARGILGLSEDKEILQISKQLPPFQIGKYGQLQEWYDDFEEAEVNHRHVSHLYGLYPGEALFKEDQRFLGACSKSLDRRQDEGTGWCIAWKACLWARLKDGERALQLLNKQLRLTREEEIKSVGGGTYPNLFCAHPPFQIDGNFGFAAAMLEMLLQSYGDKIYILPALPKAWHQGSIRGVRAKGGVELSFSWEDGKIKSLSIKGRRKGSVVLVVGEGTYDVSLSGDEQEQQIIG